MEEFSSFIQDRHQSQLFSKIDLWLEKKTLIYGRESGHDKFCFKQLTPLFLFFLQGLEEGYLVISYNTMQIFVAGWSKNQKTNQVSWENICLLKQESGLGSKNLEKFNICLLAKWRWQFLTYRSMLWYKSLSYRYDNLQQSHQMTTNTSKLWKDICGLDSNEASPTRWFSDQVQRKVRDGKQNYIMIRQIVGRELS